MELLGQSRGSAGALPGRWAAPILARFFQISPLQFISIALLTVIQKFVGMASFVIPIKLLFLASREQDVHIPFTDQTIAMGQLEVSALIIPVAALPLFNAYLSRVDLRKKLSLSEMVSGKCRETDLNPKQLKSLINAFSRSFSSLCLSLTCLAVMIILLPTASMLLAAFVFLAILIARYRIASFHSRNGFDFELDDKESSSQRMVEIRQMIDSTHAGLHIVLLPLFVYLVSGAIINNTIDPVFGLTYLILFKWFVNNSEVVSTMTSQFLHKLLNQPNTIQLLRDGALQS